VELWRDVFLGLGERDELELVECPVESGFVWGRRSRFEVSRLRKKKSSGRRPASESIEKNVKNVPRCFSL
jgi:hypothetical protein